MDPTFVDLLNESGYRGVYRLIRFSFSLSPNSIRALLSALNCILTRSKRRFPLSGPAQIAQIPEQPLICWGRWKKELSGGFTKGSSWSLSARCEVWRPVHDKWVWGPLSGNERHGYYRDNTLFHPPFIHQVLIDIKFAASTRRRITVSLTL